MNNGSELEKMTAEEFMSDYYAEMMEEIREYTER